MHAADKAQDPAHWAVVIPSYNHAEDAIACVQSLWDATPRPGAVVLVDDASTQNAVVAISDWARARGVPCSITRASLGDPPQHQPDWLTLVAAEENGGFVKAANIGLRLVRDATNYSHALLMNNDAVVTSGYFAELARALSVSENVGLLSGAIYEWDRSTIWYAGATFNPFRALGSHKTAPPEGDEPRDTGYVCGCSMLIARPVLDTVGFLAESFSPCYVEDVDYSLRVRAAGFRVMFAPRAICYHRVGTSLGRTRQSPQTIFSVNRNRGYTLRRNYRGLPRAAGVAYLALTKPGRAIWELARGRPRIARAVLSGMLAGLLTRPTDPDGDHRAVSTLLHRSP